MWNLTFELDPEDTTLGPGQGMRPVGLLGSSCHVRLPSLIAEPHPDLLALAALTIVRPWATRRLTLDRAVSSRLAEVAHRLFGLEVGPVDAGLPSRSPGAQPVLAYSAGYDSAAASELLPQHTPHIHHRRIPHPTIRDRSPAWRSDALESLAGQAQRRGKNVLLTHADFEHLVHPHPQLPHWLGFAVAPLLLADDLDAGAMVMGGTLETFYMDMGKSWTGGAPAGSGIDPLMDVVGLPMMRPLIGLSEVATMRLVLDGALAGFARSCTGGTFAAPCGVCTKCIRKDLLHSAVSGTLNPRTAALTDSSAGWKSIRPGSARPMYMQAQYEYCLARVDVSGLVLESLAQELEPDPDRTTWMERAFAEAVEVGVPERWRGEVADSIARKIGWMDEADQAAARGWPAT